MDAVVDRFGRIDVLVANAGVGSYGPFTDLADEALDALVRTNVLGVMHAVRAAVAPMDAAGRGRIVLVGSIAGRIGVPLEAAYSATKHAVDGLGRALAAELAPDGIAVTVVNLGPIDTGFAETAGHTYAPAPPSADAGRAGGRRRPACRRPARRRGDRPTLAADLGDHRCAGAPAVRSRRRARLCGRAPRFPRDGKRQRERRGRRRPR